MYPKIKNDIKIIVYIYYKRNANINVGDTK
jgi:hypothetical protein